MLGRGPRTPPNDNRCYLLGLPLSRIWGHTKLGDFCLEVMPLTDLVKMNRLAKPLTLDEGQKILERDKYRCQYCGLDGLANFENSLMLSVDLVVTQNRRPAHSLAPGFRDTPGSTGSPAEGCVGRSVNPQSVGSRSGRMYDPTSAVASVPADRHPRQSRRHAGGPVRIVLPRRAPAASRRSAEITALCSFTTSPE